MLQVLGSCVTRDLFPCFTQHLVLFLRAQAGAEELQIAVANPP